MLAMSSDRKSVASVECSPAKKEGLAGGTVASSKQPSGWQPMLPLLQ